ncbi:MAG: hypothetical protein IJW25_02805 [Clostridia bacterium]|nr:hypothetical protein [Clostridia bacterium]
MGIFQESAKRKSFKTPEGKLFLGSKANLIDVYNDIANKELCIKTTFTPFTTTSLPNSGIKSTYLVENGKLSYTEELILNGEAVMDEGIKFEFLTKDENGDFNFQCVTLIAESENGVQFEEETLKYEFEDKKGYHKDYILRTNIKGGILNNREAVIECLKQIKKLNIIKNSYEQASEYKKHKINEYGEIVR